MLHHIFISYISHFVLSSVLCFNLCITYSKVISYYSFILFYLHSTAIRSNIILSCLIAFKPSTTLSGLQPLQGCSTLAVMAESFKRRAEAAKGRTGPQQDEDGEVRVSHIATNETMFQKMKIDLFLWI